MLLRRTVPDNDTPLRKTGREDGFTLIELMVAVSILAVLSAVVLLNIGTFFGSGKAEASGVEKHQVASAVTMYRFDGHTITQPFSVGPDNKGALDPYLSGKLQYNWIIGTDGSVTPGTGYLFSSDLNSLAGFTSLLGSWTASGGVLSPSNVPYENRPWWPPADPGMISPLRLQRHLYRVAATECTTAATAIPISQAMSSSSRAVQTIISSCEKWWEATSFLLSCRRRCPRASRLTVNTISRSVCRATTRSLKWTAPR